MHSDVTRPPDHPRRHPVTQHRAQPMRRPAQNDLRSVLRPGELKQSLHDVRVDDLVVATAQVEDYRWMPCFDCGVCSTAMLIAVAAACR
ncbi:hypothetical protein [Streptomyces sp. NPDC001340]